MQAAAPPSMVVYVGVGDFGEEPKGGVLVYDFDQRLGKLSLKLQVPAGRLATFMAVAPNRRTLYVADEPTHDLSCFRIDPQHPMTPNLGQGAAMAMEDALALSQSLANHTNLAVALQSYQQRRRPRGKEIHDQSRCLGVVAQIANPMLCSVRNMAMRLTPNRLSGARAARLVHKKRISPSPVSSRVVARS